MKILKIPKIKKYKSFRDYSWHSFCNTETFHSKTNILYGENGSGKSAICNILKSVSQNKGFIRYLPEEVKIQIDKNTYEYKNNIWDIVVPHGSMLFFDREFVDSNIHLGRDRGTQQGEQEQESAKLIIEFDAEAIKLRDRRDELVGIKELNYKKLEDYLKENSTTLGFNLADEEEILFNKYKNRSRNRIDKTKKALEKRKNNLSSKIETDQQLLKRVNEIQGLQELDSVNIKLSLSTKVVYQELFNFKIREKAEIQAENSLVGKIKSYKDFFEVGFKIRNVHPKECPFCQSKGREKQIREIINVYNSLYDESYKEQSAFFESKKLFLVNELENIQKTINGFSLNDIFFTLKRLSEQYSIKNIYILKEEEKYRKTLLLKKIEELRIKIINLKNPNSEDINILYKQVKTEVNTAKKFFISISRLVERKNKFILSFKKEHTDLELLNRIEKNQAILTNIELELDFIRSNKVEKEKYKRQKQKKQQKLQEYFEKAREDHRLIREQYENYCSTEAFIKTLNKIESYFSCFNFNFKLQLDTQNRHTELTKELPFAFKVLDPEGNERDLREGLSEGEVQVLSLCFFFAFLEIQGGKNYKILVFDDPITSLDDSNLTNLVDLIASEKDKFSQIFIFTHHRTFFKFLRKRFNEKCKEYNILRNKSHLGGSFICKSQEERFIHKLENFETHLMQIAQNPSGFDVELKIVEYGQYLRYETEYFIKCRLLHWNESSEFQKVVEGIKENKKVTNLDLDKIKQIYSFCNWTTSHVDVGDDHGLAQLKEKISDFIAICDRYKSGN